jgi:hypothetical protein
VATLSSGRLVWAEIPDKNGYIKKRPAIVLRVSPDGQRVVVVACTTKCAEPLHADLEPLPWNADGKSATRLKKPTAAVCSWIAEVEVSAVVAHGEVSAERLRAVLTKVKAIHPELNET